MDTLMVNIDRKENLIEICAKGGNEIRIDVAEEFHPQIFYYFEDLKIDTVYHGKRDEQAFLQKDKSANKPLPKSVKSRAKYTKVKYKPDFGKFGITKLEDDDVAVLNRRVVDMAGCLGEKLRVLLNRQEVMLILKKVRHKKVMNPFERYFHRFLDSTDDELPRMFTKVQDNWEICLSIREGEFEQVSFVNSIATVKGGSHVNHITNQITDHLIKVLNKKYKNANLQAVHVKNYLWVFVNAFIDNPTIDAEALGQETLIQPNSFGSQFKLPKQFLEQAAKHAEEILFPEEWKRRLKIQIPKLIDAKLAGIPSYECTLIVVEGDSAMSLARAGIATFNRETRDLYGLYPLSGKLANVRNTNVTKAMLDYVEVKNLKKILGLKIGAHYENLSSLRYRRLMIMTDQDYDGYHIKGLIINLIYSFWPSLLTIKPSFFMEFKTPIIKAFGKKIAKEEKFYSKQDYESWNANLSGSSASDWHIRYYKGLGTNTVKEGMEYFKGDELGVHQRKFLWVTELDTTSLDIAFSENKIKERKDWVREGQLLQLSDLSLSQHVQPVVRQRHITHYTVFNRLIPSVNFQEFVNDELRPFAVESIRRAIPCLLDGLKPSQRKVLYSAFKRENFIKEARVLDFSGYVSDASAYHHGKNLDKTIIRMAQDFVGRSNINLLLPLGQFGSRYKGGKDHAASHYINTKLSPITRFIFVEDDDMLLSYLQEDGKSVEPKFYLPIIPLARL
ncbi:hypothetical protein M0R45_001968 [Rubus argutus]|uniref:DNA topoisomerase 2 n=1 Tax=Rubus argutus TaxID=59490 RepID=A0AAW1VE02_RUBAR